MKPVVTTLIMAALAFASSAAAYYFYPRMEVEQKVERTQLLTEEEAFEPGDIREITIERFDQTRKTSSGFSMKLEEGSWVIPANQNYPVSNTARVAAITNAFRDKEVLEEVSDERDDHEKYGVLDSNERGRTGLGAGTVLEFEGRNRKRLGRMIVGTSPDGKPEQRYVRLAGQPTIYVIEFDSSVLTTDFADWVDGSLIQVGGAGIEPAKLVGMIDRVTVDLYYRNSANSSTKQSSYRAVIRQTPKAWLCDTWLPDDKGELPEEPSTTDQEANQQTLGFLIGQVLRVSLQDVSPKQSGAAASLAEPKESQLARQFDSLRNYGFYHTGFKDGRHLFESAAGEVKISYRFGLETTAYIGTPDNNVSAGMNINRFMMLTANVNESLVPKPTKEDMATAAEDQSEEDIERALQAALNLRQQYLDEAVAQARAYNEIHADWVYVLPDDAIQRLVPPADSWKKQAN